MRHLLPLAIAAIPLVFIAVQLVAQETGAKSGSPSVVLRSGVEWGALNPARGEKGPRAADLWGDRTGDSATGFLVKFKDGFSSPPHIHNVTYRGIVISGLVHNDDPAAAKTWMPPGSYWTQPAGEVHITAAKGQNVVAYIEIQEGPYLVQPREQASDNGERPINVDPSNYVWLDNSVTSWIDASAKGVKLAYLWGHPESEKTVGTLVKLPSGFDGFIHNESTDLRAVVIKGELEYQAQATANRKGLSPGTYFALEDNTACHLLAGQDNDCLVYIRSKGTFQITRAKKVD